MTCLCVVFCCNDYFWKFNNYVLKDYFEQDKLQSEEILHEVGYRAVFEFGH